MPHPEEFLYFTDPMCSWCYGFAPVMRQLMEKYSHRFSLRIVAGGLRPYETKPMGNTAPTLVKHWEKVIELTGRTFDKTFFEKFPGFVYNTGFGCRAVTAVNRMNPKRTLDYLEDLQNRFYAKGEDPTALTTFRAAATKAGLDADAFERVYGEPETEVQLKAGYEEFQQLGGMGFPMVLVFLGGRYKPLTIGWQPFDRVAGTLDKLLA